MNILGSLFNLAGPDLMIILLIVLLLFGAKKLPELAKGMGQAVREFNKAKDDLEREINRPANELTVQKPADQQPHQPNVLPSAAAPVAPIAPVAPVAPVAPAPQAPAAQSNQVPS